MNYLIIFKMIGTVLRFEMLAMLAPLLVSIIYQEDDTPAFVISIVIVGLLSLLLSSLKPKHNKLQNREGFVVVALTWLAFSLLGALPFYFCGYFPTYADCFFEAASGFSTTGASVLTSPESLPRGILFWRSFTHWMGGMGVLVFMLAIMPMAGGGSSLNILKAESSGPAPGKMLPKIKETAKIMYLIYVVMTLINIIFLLFFGLPLYDALNVAFATASTGGFSIMNQSMGAYGNIPAEVVTTVFMFLFGVNFKLYFYILKKQFGVAFADEELLLYFAIVAISIIIISIDIMPMYGSLGETLRHSSFQVSSMITSTGFATTDFNLWPSLSKLILIFLMFTGACAGSTSGGLKIVRFVVLFKSIRIELGKIIHPRLIQTIKLDGVKVENSLITKVFLYFCVYLLIMFVSVLVISLEGKDMATTVTSVIATLGNTGPGLGVVGPMGNYSDFTPFSKYVLSFCMLAGRLELYPVLILFMPSIWRRGSVN